MYYNMVVYVRCQINGESQKCKYVCEYIIDFIKVYKNGL